METISIYPCDSKGNLLSGYCVFHFNALSCFASTLYGWKKFGVKYYNFNGKVIDL